MTVSIRTLARAVNPKGFTGSRGDFGFSGSQGNLGYTGSQGAGYTGSQGTVGDPGYTGSQGAGYTGSQGSVGGTGFTGSQGVGYTGSQGPTTIDASALTGATLASGVTASSLTSVGTLAGLTVTAPITGSVTGSSGSTTGNAATATALATARNINGVSFNGTADITVTAPVTLAATSTNATFYPLMYNASTGTTSTLNVDTGWTFNPSTNIMSLAGNVNANGYTVAMANGLIQEPIMSGTREVYGQAAISGGTLALYLGDTLVYRVARNANISTITFSALPPTSRAYSFTLIFDANGTAYTTTWPASVKWPGGTAPTITTTASRSDMFVFYTNNAGTTWYAMTAAQNFVTT